MSYVVCWQLCVARSSGVDSRRARQAKCCVAVLDILERVCVGSAQGRGRFFLDVRLDVLALYMSTLRLDCQLRRSVALDSHRRHLLDTLERACVGSVHGSEGGVEILNEIVDML